MCYVYRSSTLLDEYRFENIYMNSTFSLDRAANLKTNPNVPTKVLCDRNYHGRCWYWRLTLNNNKIDWGRQLQNSTCWQHHHINAEEVGGVESTCLLESGGRATYMKTNANVPTKVLCDGDYHGRCWYRRLTLNDNNIDWGRQLQNPKCWQDYNNIAEEVRGVESTFLL